MANEDDRRRGNGSASDSGNAGGDAVVLAALATTADRVLAAPAGANPPDRPVADAFVSQPGQEVVFIDGAMPDAQFLAAGVKPGVWAVILDSGRDGVAQIAAWLTSHDARNLAAIAIVSHGADGVLFLGAGVLDSTTLGQYRAELAGIGASLSPGGGLLLYGCDVAQDAKGVAFVDQLAVAVGGNVAAASHLVGAASLGGSFTLDVNTGQIAAPTPFTAQTQASFSGVLPTAINQLYFTVGNTTPTNTVNRVNQIGVSGTATIGAATDLIDGSQAVFGNGTTVISLPGVAVDPAIGKFFFTDTNSNASYNKLWQGNIGSPGGTLTQIVSTPTTTTQLQGLALDQPNGNLYYALNASAAGSIGIYQVSESGGTPIQVVSGFTSAAHALFQIALDIPDNLVFFADSPGLTSVSTLWAGNIISHTETALATSAKGARLEGVAYNNGTIYWSTLNGSTIANNGIFSAPVIVSGSGSLATASLGTTSTLYAGAATGNGTVANTPISLAVDPSSGVLYSGSNIVTGGTNFAIVNAGTVTGGSSMTTIFSSAFAGTSVAAPPIVALTLETTPTVAASGNVNYVVGGTAVAVAPAAVVSNPSGFNLANATVAITGGTFVNDGDTLTATVAGTSISASFSGETLTLSGNDTLAHYKQVLDSVAFASTAADPGNGGANVTRTVSWTVSDGLISSTTPTSTLAIQSLCFCAGTAILTPRGEVPVERLRPGGRVVTESGAVRRIQWVGTGQVLATRGRRGPATPVIVRKDAFAENVPHKDLRVTKGHSFHVDGVLIPVEFLVNYRSIVWDDRAQEVRLFHIELESHDVLIANGAPAESYRDDGNRWLFQNANDTWNLPPKSPCAPVLTGGPEVDAVWRRLLDRAGQRAGPPMTGDPDLHLRIDGRRVDGRARPDGSYLFTSMGRPDSVRLVSRDTVPAEWGMARDFRSLGVAVKRLSVRRGRRSLDMLADDATLTDGFHAFEPGNGCRWTNGDAGLPPPLFADCDGPWELVVRAGGVARYIDDRPARVVA